MNLTRVILNRSRVKRKGFGALNSEFRGKPRRSREAPTRQTDARPYTDDVEWWKYVEEVKGSDSTHKVAAKMGDRTSPATVNRWKGETKKPDADKVVAFCRAYGENPVVGFVRAGYITEDEARAYSVAAKSTEDLLADMQAEIERRAKRRR